MNHAISYVCTVLYTNLRRRQLVLEKKMCFIEFFGLNCFSEETEFLFVSDCTGLMALIYGPFCLVGAVHSSAIYPFVDGFKRINQRSVPIKNSYVF